MSAFATYRTFTDPEEAEALATILDHHGIPYRIDRAETPVLTFSSDMVHERLMIAVPPDLFREADKAQEAAVPDLPAEAFGDHYFSEYSSDELLEVLHKADEWSPGDVIIARRLLADRGVETDSAEIAAKQQENLVAKRQPIPGNPFLLGFGFVLAFLGGILGFFLGWSYATLKDRDASGVEYHRYDAHTRELGQWMMATSVLCFIGWLLYRFA